MSFFGRNNSDRIGAIIDIGSGSVLVAIVHSESDKKHPTIIWSHRENTPLTNIESLDQSLRAIVTALFNASMKLDGEGRKVLEAYKKGARINEVLVGISAPWSFTITKTINYAQDETFAVTDDLIAELIETAQAQIDSEINTKDTLNNQGLSSVAALTMGLRTNGYHIKHPQGQQSSELNISQANVVAQTKLLEATYETLEKVFARTTTRTLSFITMLYSITKDTLPNTQNACVVDITNEATEIGIIRNGVLTYTTHTAFGSASLAREISAITKMPLHESLGHLQTDNPYAFIEKLPDTQANEVKQVFEAYTERIADLFKQTGDSLVVPKYICFHTELEKENIYIDILEKAAKRSIKTQPILTGVSSTILKNSYEADQEFGKNIIPFDTALLVSARFFHKESEFQNYQYL